jgi:hypothetical protein
VRWPRRSSYERLNPACGGAVLIALAVCMVTWPLMDVATRHDNVRFE